MGIKPIFASFLRCNRKLKGGSLRASWNIRCRCSDTRRRLLIWDLTRISLPWTRDWSKKKIQRFRGKRRLLVSWGSLGLRPLDWGHIPGIFITYREKENRALSGVILVGDFTWANVSGCKVQELNSCGWQQDLLYLSYFDFRRQWVYFCVPVCWVGKIDT